ncbi:MAG TPA: SGNH/GDSL hydrolase family protein [Capsulimonadaceae bacterium]|jgi:hypothetical protein
MNVNKLIVAIALVATSLSPMATAARAADAPTVHREGIEWTDAWIVDGNGTTLPRVLLIGDSITRQYYATVAQGLRGTASVSRVSTSRSVGDPGLVDELAPTLKAYKWDIVHFNNGMHGWGYTEDEYKKAYPDVIAAIAKLAPGAKIIIALTTPIVDGPDKSTANPRTDRVIARNAAASAFAASKNLPVDDLFAIANGHPEYFDGGGIHFNPTGVPLEGAQVVAAITPLLPKK